MALEPADKSRTDLICVRSKNKASGDGRVPETKDDEPWRIIPSDGAARAVAPSERANSVSTRAAEARPPISRERLFMAGPHGERRGGSVQHAVTLDASTTGGHGHAIASFAPAASKSPPLRHAAFEGEIEILPKSTPLAAVGDDAPRGPNWTRLRALAKALASSVERSRSALDDEGADAHFDPAQRELIARGKRLFERYKRENGRTTSDEDVDPRGFADWLLCCKTFLAPPSWRLYRTAAAAFVQTLPHHELDAALSAIEADIGADAGEKRAVRRSQRGGPHRAQPVRPFESNDFEKIVAMLPGFNRSKAGPWLRDWMLAGIDTGVAPSAWAVTELEVRRDPSRRTGRRAWLHVAHANAISRQAPDSVYTLDISGFSGERFEAVRAMVDRAAKWTFAEQYPMRQSQCAQLLYDIGARLFPSARQRYSLYSLRQQFIANMRTVYGPAEVAALTGHAIGETASEHNGKQHMAWANNIIRDVPVPLVSQVARARRRLQLFEQRLDIQTLRRRMAENRKRARDANQD